MDPRVRFMQKIDLTVNPPHWIWTGTFWSEGKGYGLFRFESKLQLAHRVSYKMFIGPIPEGLDVLHHCDIPPCVKPECLFTGTQADNMKDMHLKNRGSVRRGEASNYAKLTESKVRMIRDLSARGCTQAQLATVFGIDQGQVSRIINRRSWTHI